MFGERLRKLRTKQGKTQKEIAEALGFKTSTYTFYENEKREPDFKTLIALADYFGVSCDYLLRGVDAPYVDICRKTGLTQQTIDALVERNEQYPDNGLNRTLINLVLQDSDFWDCLEEQATNAAFAYHGITDFVNRLDELVYPDEVERKRKILTKNFEKDINAAQYTIALAFGNLFVKLYKQVKKDMAERKEINAPQD